MFNDLNIIPKPKAGLHRQSSTLSIKHPSAQHLSIKLLSGILLLTAAPLAQALTQSADAESNYRFHPTLADNTIDTIACCDDDIDYMRLQLPVFQQNQYQQQDQHHAQNLQAYFAYQAQAWLQYAKHENSINSQSAAGSHALQTGSTVVQALQEGNNNRLTLLSDIPKTSALMRPDLWATLNALKNSGGINTAPKALAFSEVALIWAAADQCKYGADASSAPFRMADRWLQQAREAYVQAHDSQSNVQLETRINNYYKQYAPLAATDDNCTGQPLALNLNAQSSNTQSFNTQIFDAQVNSALTLPQNIIIQMLTPTVTYRIID